MRINRFEVIIYAIENKNLNFFYEEIFQSFSIFPMAYLNKGLFYSVFERPVFLFMFLGILVYLLSINLFIADYVKDKRILSFLPLIVKLLTVLINRLLFIKCNFLCSYFPGNSQRDTLPSVFIPLFLYALLKNKKVLILMSLSIFSFIHPTYALISY